MFDISELGGQGLRILHSILHLSHLEYVFIYTSHHIISDAWSSSLLFRETLQVYHDLLQGKPISLPAIKYQFIDYVNWEINWFQSAEYARSLKIWRNLIPNDPEPSRLPSDYTRPPVIKYEGALETATLDAGLVSKIANFSRLENVNVFHTLLSVFNILLYKYSGDEDIVVGIPLANRNIKEFQNTLGLFLNTLPHKTKLDVTGTFRDYLLQVKDISQTVILNQELPFEKLIEEIRPIRDRGISPIFQVLFVYQNIPSLYDWNGIKLSPEKADYNISK
ncbi:condensation domain-containing protein, partial [uncultured Mucilaginibacter sp.]|uniref:condensation domain-containing protein n=1 Tax=uncultured Mucilaginibacter sp. TaxID=797541 RepID=UPI00345BCD11